MRPMSIGVMILVISFLSGSSLVGQNQKGDPTKDPEPKAKGQLPRFYNKIGLSDEQKQAIYKVQTTYNAKIDALRKQIKDLQNEESISIEKTLTKAQLERLVELKTESLKLDKDKEKDSKEKDSKSKDAKDK